MADTTAVAIDAISWTEVSANANGFFTNSSGVPIFYREAAAAPAASVTTGHVLNPGESKPFASLGAGQEIYARATNDSAAPVVIVTEGATFL